MDHAPVWSVGGVLISLSVAFEPVGGQTTAVCDGQCDTRPIRLPSRSQINTVLWPVPNCKYCLVTVRWSEVEPATSRSRVRHANHYTTKPETSPSISVDMTGDRRSQTCDLWSRPSKGFQTKARNIIILSKVWRRRMTEHDGCKLFLYVDVTTS